MVKSYPQLIVDAMSSESYNDISSFSLVATLALVLAILSTQATGITTKEGQLAQY